MAFKRSNLAWSNISREDLLEDDKHIWDAFLKAKAELEAHLILCAQAAGTMQEGDNAKFAYGSIGQGTVGMAIAEPEKAQRTSGFSGLKRPTKIDSLSDWQRERDAMGYRR